MAKLATTALAGGLITLCSAAPMAQADTFFGVYAGAGTWQQEFSGDVTSGPTRVDVENDLGLADDSNNIFYVAVEHPLPLLPNIRAQHMAMEVDGSNVLSRSIEFNGDTFTVSDTVSTVVDITQTDAVFYYEVLDNIVSLDVGLAVSLIEGTLSVSNSTDRATAEFDEVVPMLYGKVRADLPLTGLWVAAEGQGVSYDGNSLLEANAHIGYESVLGLGIEAGYRTVRMELDGFEDVQAAELDISGPYAAINFHF